MKRPWAFICAAEGATSKHLRNYCREVYLLGYLPVCPKLQGPWQGDMNAVIASCSEYTWLTKHKRVDGTMYSCTSLGVKLGGGLGTAITGWLLAFSNYDKALAVQPESCINMLKLMYLVIPFVLDAIITFILSRMKVEEANDKIRAEMKN